MKQIECGASLDLDRILLLLLLVDHRAAARSN